MIYFHRLAEKWIPVRRGFWIIDKGGKGGIERERDNEVNVNNVKGERKESKWDICSQERIWWSRSWFMRGHIRSLSLCYEGVLIFIHLIELEVLSFQWIYIFKCLTERQKADYFQPLEKRRMIETPCYTTMLYPHCIEEKIDYWFISAF